MDEGEVKFSISPACARRSARMPRRSNCPRASPRSLRCASHLRARGGVYENAFAEKALLRSAVNQDMVPPTATVKAGDEVAFFPPVTGG